MAQTGEKLPYLFISLSVLRPMGMRQFTSPCLSPCYPPLPPHASFISSPLYSCGWTGSIHERDTHLSAGTCDLSIATTVVGLDLLDFTQRGSTGLVSGLGSPLTSSHTSPTLPRLEALELLKMKAPTLYTRNLTAPSSRLLLLPHTLFTSFNR